MSFIGCARAGSLFRRAAAIGFLLLGLGAIGCGHGDVSGKVTYEDKPLTWGTVLIEGSDGIAKQGNIEPDGSYTVKGVATGDAKVAVNSPNPKSITIVTKGDKPAQSFPDAPGWFAIPKEYGEIATSGLTYPIKSGQNTYDIKLKKK